MEEIKDVFAEITNAAFRDKIYHIVTMDNAFSVLTKASDDGVKYDDADSFDRLDDAYTYVQRKLQERCDMFIKRHTVDYEVLYSEYYCTVVSHERDEREGIVIAGRTIDRVVFHILQSKYGGFWVRRATNGYVNNIGKLVFEDATNETAERFDTLEEAHRWIDACNSIKGNVTFEERLANTITAIFAKYGDPKENAAKRFKRVNKVKAACLEKAKKNPCLTAKLNTDEKLENFVFTEMIYLI